MWLYRNPKSFKLLDTEDKDDKIYQMFFDKILKKGGFFIDNSRVPFFPRGINRRDFFMTKKDPLFIHGYQNNRLMRYNYIVIKKSNKIFSLDQLNIYESLQMQIMDKLSDDLSLDIDMNKYLQDIIKSENYSKLYFDLQEDLLNFFITYPETIRKRLEFFAKKCFYNHEKEVIEAKKDFDCIVRNFEEFSTSIMNFGDTLCLQN